MRYTDKKSQKERANDMERKIAEVILYFLYGGLKQLSQQDTRIAQEVRSWKPGMIYALKCGSDGPDLYIRKGEYGLEKLDSSLQDVADVCIEFKSFCHAFLILTGRQSVASSYAEHNFTMYGDIAQTMSFARCIDILEAYLFPKIITKRILKEIPKKEKSSIFLYRKILWAIPKEIREERRRGGRHETALL